MNNSNSGRKHCEPEDDEQRCLRLMQEAEDRRAEVTAEDAKVQRMIERSIKDYGA
jgi:hypothetical protein